MPRRKKSDLESVEKAQATFGKEFIRLGMGEEHKTAEILTTGVEEIDSMLTNPDGSLVGGLPANGLYLIAGQPGAGKSLLCTWIIAQFQSTGKRIAWIDSERRLVVSGTDRMKALGVDPDEIIFIGGGSISGSPVSYILEDTLGVVSKMAAAKLFDVLVIDSVTALIPRGDAEKALGGTIPFDSKQLASRAAALSTVLPIVSGLCTDYGVTSLSVCQLRENPGVMFGRKDYIPGGSTARYTAHGIYALSASDAKAYDEETRRHNCKLTIWKSAVTTDHMKQIELSLPTTLEEPDADNTGTE